MNVNKFTLILAFVLVCIVLFLTINFFSRPVPKTPSPKITPTPIKFEQKVELETTDFTIVEIIPDTKTPLSDRFQPLEIIFNKPVNKNTIHFTFSPNNKVTTNFYKTKIDFSSLQIIPLDPWNDLQNYQLILSKDIQTENGIKLGKDFIIDFRVEAYKGL